MECPHCGKHIEDDDDERSGLKAADFERMKELRRELNIRMYKIIHKMDKEQND